MTTRGVEFRNYFDRSRPMELLDTGSGVAIGDYDNDGLADIYFVGGEISNRLFRNVGGFQFEDVTESAGVAGQAQGNNLFGSGATFADIDDFYVNVPPRKETNYAFRNLGDLKFERTKRQWRLDHNGISHGAAFSDLDGDGDLDLVVNNCDENALVYRNDCDTNCLVRSSLPTKQFLWGRNQGRNVARRLVLAWWQVDPTSKGHTTFPMAQVTFRNRTTCYGLIGKRWSESIS